MMYEQGDEELENCVSDSVDCCDNPDIEFSDWKWDSEIGGWNFAGMCHNCWELCYGKIRAVEVEVKG